MVSDRALAEIFGLRPATIALYGDAIRAISLMIVALLIAAMTVVYAETLKHTITIRHLQDFGAFYQSAASGATVVTRVPESTGPTRRDTPPDLNPPHFRVAILPFTLLDPEPAFIAWMAASAAAYISSLVMISRSLALNLRRIALLFAWTYLSSAMYATLLAGQVALVLLLPVTLGWRALRRGRDFAAAGWLGVCASLKPPLLLLAPALAVAKRSQAAVVMSGVAAALFACGLALFGLDAHREWIRNLAAVNWTEHYLNMSLLGLLERTLSTSEWSQRPIANVPALIRPFWVIAASAIGIATCARARRLANADELLLLVIAAALLLSPIAWVYYWWLLMPPLAAVLAEPARRISPTRATMLAISMAGFMVPPMVPWTAGGWSGLATLTIGSDYCWSLLLLWVFAATGFVHPRPDATVA